MQEFLPLLSKKRIKRFREAEQWIGTVAWHIFCFKLVMAR
ncbi:hypothetical protein B4098_0937 [Heyndrickxia coagulans]|uniref:Uncharacterized protein n=1 Tax=Heyndrickxia coagulans TaxID=1398 RepID=A0A150K822_HEYCO|nr:hypothetical protein B4098_0937 [Heyndrickxia coagulans]